MTEQHARQVYTQFDAMESGHRQNALVQSAEEEGEVRVQLRVDNVFPAMERAFEAKYNVDLVIENPGNVETVRQQVFMESRAGRQSSDVVETFVHELNTMYQETNVVAPMPRFLKDRQVHAELVSEFSIETFQYSFGNIWSAEQIGERASPMLLSDFADPSWGKELVMSKGSYAWYLASYQLMRDQGRSVEEFEEVMRTIASRASVAPGNNPAIAGIASGEYAAGAGLAHVSAQKISAPSPIRWEPATDPIVLIPAGVGLLAEAEHPAAAMLFVDWYLTEGQSILEEEQLVLQSSEESDFQDASFWKLDDADLSGKQFEQWRLAYRNLLSGLEPIVPEHIESSDGRS